MSDIELYSRSPKKAAFDENRLIRSEYTTTLLNEAVRIGRITEEEALGINAKITNHLSEVVDQYTDGKSSSLPADVTGNLLASLYYNVDAALIASGTPEAALKMVSEKTAAYLYDTGSAALKREIILARFEFSSVTSVRMRISLSFFLAPAAPLKAVAATAE